MWIPGSAAELEAALVGDGIEESAIFDGKRELSKNEDLAVDICAMTVEGGVLVYGAGESADKTRLTEPHPLSLAGRRERVSQVAQTAISEPPAIDVRALERDDSPGEGYLVVVVPQSARAPHQIVLKGKHQGRYYGRDATGNRILAQAEVELLYARRTRWEHDALEEADAALRRRSSAAYTGDPGRVFLLIGVKPLGSTRSFLINAGSANGGSEITALTRATETALAAFPGQGFSPDLHSLAGTWTRSDADHWTAAHVPRGKPELTMDVEHDGTADPVLSKSRRPAEGGACCCLRERSRGTRHSGARVVWSPMRRRWLPRRDRRSPSRAPSSRRAFDGLGTAARARAGLSHRGVPSERAVSRNDDR